MRGGVRMARPLIGDALAVVGWISLFEAGLIVDPRPIFSAVADDTVVSLLSALPPENGVAMLASVEQLRRVKHLAADWEWEVVGIGRARVAFMLRLDIEPRYLNIQTERAMYRARAI